MRLTGEADLTTAGQLSALIIQQLDGEAHQLAIDVSGLRFADVAAIRTLVLAASTLKRQGGRLVLLHPQPPVAKIVTLLGADQVVMLQETWANRYHGGGWTTVGRQAAPASCQVMPVR